MGYRTRRWIGVAVLAIFVPIYVLIAMEVGARYIDSLSGVIQFVYYLVAGFAWTLPAMMLIKWMRKVPRPQNRVREDFRL